MDVNNLIKDLNERTMEFVPYNTSPSISLSLEAELALKLLPFVIQDVLQYNNKFDLSIAIKKSKDLAKEFMNYKP